MELSKDIHTIFFLGIGGIGMSALARYFRRVPVNGCRLRVAGYDRTSSALTQALEEEGIAILYNDSIEDLGLKIGEVHPTNTMVVRTPAVPEDSALLRYFRSEGYRIYKRAEVLGMVTSSRKALCVAGTHGKTTTSTMLAHLMSGIGKETGDDGVNAFLGGISMNYGTNVLMSPCSEYVVVEADEYDRSFHHLHPYISVVTAVDADHLDIYGSAEAYREAFAHYTSLISAALVMKEGIALEPRLREGVKCYTYGVESGEWRAESGEWRVESGDRPDFYAANIRVQEGQIIFDFVTPDETIADVQLGVPVWVNIENAVAAMAVAWLVERLELREERFNLRERMGSFKGVQRRFNIHVNTPHVVYIDDYAHHPEEIATAIDSVRKLYPDRRLIGVFQPHLYTRTRDFAADFRRVLGRLDECVLLPIYPAREEPIPGVTSEMLLEGLPVTGDVQRVVEKAELVEELKRRVAAIDQPVVVLTVGAGDIDRLVHAIAEGIGDL